MNGIVTLSPFSFGVAIGATCSLILAIIVAWLLLARQRKSVAITDRKLQQLETQEHQFIAAEAIAQQKTADLLKLESRIQALDEQLEASRQELLSESTQRVKAEQEAVQVEPLQQRVATKEKTISAQVDELSAMKSANAELATRIEAERKHTSEKLELVKNAEKQMVHQFEALGAKILEEKGKAFTEQNKLNLDRVLLPLREQLGDFRKKVDDVHVEDTRDRASLREAIRTLNQQNQRITEEASNLVRALKGDKKAQGTWGELVLEKVLQQSGLRKGVEYETQGAFRDRDNRLLKPDVIVHLPDGREIVIDSKVSLLAYETYTSADSEELRKQAITEHVQAIVEHIKTLSEKDYSNVKGLRSLDFVLMFMPIETAFMVAFEHDESLFSKAFEHNIIVVTPTTLLATLRTIDNIWRYERQNENARIIADKAGSLYDKIRGFVEDFEKLGVQISTVHGTYESSMNKLTQGRGNLVRQANSFVELGVKVKKTLPRSVLDQALGEETDDETGEKSD